jgi:protein-disulfide isomerase
MGALATSSLLVAGAASASSVEDHPQARHARTLAVVEHLLRGIPQSGIVLGDRHAPVTLQVFGDLECPICREFALHAEIGLIGRFVRTGKLKIESRSLETATRETRVFLEQQVAALAAGRQDKLWYFTELFYREQGLEDSGYVNESYLRGLARQVPGLDFTSWIAARQDPTLLAEVASDTQRADRWRFTGTPSFLIGRTGGPPQMLKNPSLEGPADFEAAIERLLRSDR